MDYISASDELKKGKLAPIYLLYGPEDLLCRDFLTALRSQVLNEGDEWNQSRLDWPVSAADVIGLCQTLPFMAQYRLVIVYGAALFAAKRGKAGQSGQAGQSDTDDDAAGAEPEAVTTGDADSAWSAYFASPCQTTILVFVAGDSVDRRTRLFKQVDKIGRVVECAPFKRQRELVDWLRVRALKFNTKITDDAAALLALNVAGGLRGLETELTKLATYVGKEGAIDRPAVELLVPKTAEVRMFDLIDAVADGRQKLAVDLLSEALSQGEQPLKITALLARQFRLALQARVALEQGTAPGQLAAALGLHPFVAEKVARQCRRFSREALCRAMELLLEADVAIKTGRREARLALEVLVVELLSLVSA